MTWEPKNKLDDEDVDVSDDDTDKDKDDDKHGEDTYGEMHGGRHEWTPLYPSQCRRMRRLQVVTLSKTSPA